VQYSIVQYNTVPYSTAKYGTVQDSIVQCGTVQYSAEQYNYSTDEPYSVPIRVLFFFLLRASNIVQSGSQIIRKKSYLKEENLKRNEICIMISSIKKLEIIRERKRENMRRKSIQ
jgi:hypothetical protein